MEWKNGEAKVKVYFFGLEPRAQQIDFKASYTLNGQARTDSRTLNITVQDSDVADFEPFIEHLVGPNFTFRDLTENFCKAEIAVINLNGNTDWNTGDVRYTITTDNNGGHLSVNVTAGPFVDFEWAKWNKATQCYLAFPVSFFTVDFDVDNTVLFTIRDYFRRCRDIFVSFNVNQRQFDYTVSDYYLMKEK